jgi:hypothetical protein
VITLSPNGFGRTDDEESLMRRMIVLGCALAAVGAAALAAPASAAPQQPSCLVTSAMPKAELCVHLERSGANRTAVATYQTQALQPATLAVSIVSGGLDTPSATLADQSMTGVGNLTETSAAVADTGQPLLRACATLTWPDRPGTLQSCTTSSS